MFCISALIVYFVVKTPYMQATLMNAANIFARSGINIGKVSLNPVNAIGNPADLLNNNITGLLPVDEINETYGVEVPLGGDIVGKYLGGGYNKPADILCDEVSPQSLIGAEKNDIRALLGNPDQSAVTESGNVLDYSGLKIIFSEGDVVTRVEVTAGICDAGGSPLGLGRAELTALFGRPDSEGVGVDDVYYLYYDNMAFALSSPEGEAQRIVFY